MAKAKKDETVDMDRLWGPCAQCGSNEPPHVAIYSTVPNCTVCASTLAEVEGGIMALVVERTDLDEGGFVVRAYEASPDAGPTDSAALAEKIYEQIVAPALAGEFDATSKEPRPTAGQTFAATLALKQLEVQFAARKTLIGDLVDMVRTECQALPDVWALLSEDHRHDCIERWERRITEQVRLVVNTLAALQRPSVQGRFAKMVIKPGKQPALQIDIPSSAHLADLAQGMFDGVDVLLVMPEDVAETYGGGVPGQQQDLSL